MSSPHTYSVRDHSSAISDNLQSDYARDFDALTTHVLHDAAARCHSSSQPLCDSATAHWLTTYEFSHAVDVNRDICPNMYQPDARVLHHGGAAQVNLYRTLEVSVRASQLIVESRSPTLDNNINARGDMTTEGLLNAVYVHHMRFHRLHELASAGCMYWQPESKSLLDRLGEGGWIVEHDSDRGRDETGGLSRQTNIPLPPMQGTFYQVLPPPPTSTRRMRR